MFADMEEISLEDMIKGKRPMMSKPKKKSKIAGSMEELEEFALKVAECKAFSGEVKSKVKEHVMMIREILAKEYTK